MVETKKTKKWYKRWYMIVAYCFVGLMIIGAILPDTETNQNQGNLALTDNLDNSYESNVQKIYVCSDGSEVGNSNDCPEEEIEVCNPNWQCSSWSECSTFGKKSRTCTDINDCGTTTSKPVVSQSCTIEVVEPDPISLSGSGQEATQTFRLEKGLSIFEMNNQGSNNFIIWLLDSNGNNVELLINEIGSFDSSTAVGIGIGGNYLLDVKGNSWSVNIKQPRPSSAPSVPKTITGNSHKATEFFTLDGGLTRFNLKYSGNDNFIVWLLDKDGNGIELLVNEIGSFDGSTAIGLNEGIYLLDVTGDGNWEINIE